MFDSTLRGFGAWIGKRCLKPAIGLQLSLLLAMALCCTLLALNSAQASSLEKGVNTTYQYDANSKVKGCVAYRRRDGSWSRNYKVLGEFLSGTELHAKVKDHSYETDIQYFLIHWKNGGYSSLYLGKTNLPANTQLTTEDQIGKTWRIDLGWEGCTGISQERTDLKSSLASGFVDKSRYQLDKTGKIKGCASYQRKDGSWSKNYKVRGELLTGQVVLSKIQDSGDYKVASDLYDAQDYYFFIHWKKGEPSVLHVGSAEQLFNLRSLQDQNGKTWTLTSGWDDCSNSFFDSW